MPRWVCNNWHCNGARLIGICNTMAKSITPVFSTIISTIVAIHFKVRGGFINMIMGWNFSNSIRKRNSSGSVRHGYHGHYSGYGLRWLAKQKAVTASKK